MAAKLQHAAGEIEKLLVRVLPNLSSSWVTMSMAFRGASVAPLNETRQVSRSIDLDRELQRITERRREKKDTLLVCLLSDIRQEFL